jgi:AcrR family transcriptional regulator
MARPLSEAARQKMLDTAHDIIVVDGLDACTVDEVARRSGVAKTTIYRHFKNADDLSIAAIECMADDVAVPDEGSLDADLRRLIAHFGELLRQPESRRMFVALLHRSLDDRDFERTLRRSREMEHGPLRLVLQRAIARGEVDPEIDLELAMQFVKGPFVTSFLVGGDEELTDADIESLITLVCRALAPSGPGQLSEGPPPGGPGDHPT